MTDWKILRYAMPLIGLLALTLGGCGITGQSPPTRFYMLASVSDAGAGLEFSADKQYTLVSLDPVEFPDYLDRRHMVIRESGNRYQVAEFDRWAESLQSNFERVLVQNLNRMVREEPVAVVQWRRYLDIDYFLRVKVTCLEGDTGGHVTLGVTWMLFEEEGESPVWAKVSTYTEQAAPGDYGELAAAQSRALEAFSRDVAGAIQGLPRQGRR